MGASRVEDKHAGHFRDELVGAAVEMILKRWRPEPAPEWVTCVPSLRHRTLVPDFANRLAQKLALPFREVVSKVRDNPPQKLQNNSFFQCRNLDGAFEVKNNIPQTPVILVDDMTDSRWTLTVIAAFHFVGQQAQQTIHTLHALKHVFARGWQFALPQVHVAKFLYKIEPFIRDDPCYKYFWFLHEYSTIIS